MRLAAIWASLAIAVAGAAMAICSCPMPRYTDGSAFHREISEMDVSGDYYRIREKYATPKDDLFDYAITAVMVGLGVAAAAIYCRKLRTPRKRWVIFLIGIVAIWFGASLTACYETMGVARGDIYHLDGMGLGFILGVILLHMFVCLCSLVLTWPGFRTGVPLFPLRAGNFFYTALFAVSVLVTAYFIAFGAFWFVPAAAVWVYFYWSLMTGSRKNS